VNELGGRETNRSRARPALAFVLVAAGLLACQDERPHAEPRGAATARGAANAAPAAHTMVVDVVHVKGDANIDPIAVGRTLRGAETALLSCVDADDSTGVLALKFVIERHGSVGDVTELSTTTYGSEASRVCMERIVAAMQFPPLDGRGEAEVTFEIRGRH
jgi:hypothetical protein